MGVFDKMLSIYIVALLLPSSLSYSIKVKGTIDLGDKVSDVLKELKDHLLTQVNRGNSQQDMTYSIPVAQKSDGMPAPQNFPYISNIPYIERQPQDVRVVDKIDIPLLEEIVNKKTNRMHVYGEHGRFARDKGPLNDITV